MLDTEQMKTVIDERITDWLEGVGDEGMKGLMEWAYKTGYEQAAHDIQDRVAQAVGEAENIWTYD